MSPRLSSLGLTVFFAMTISVPGVLMLGGARPGEIENSELEPVPAVDLAAIGDATFFQGVSRAFEDRLPLRDKVVALDAQVSLRIFGDSPSEDVVIGRDGYLFYARSLDQVCPPTDDVALAERELAESAALADAVGMDFVFVVAPDKASIYPDKLAKPSQCVTESEAFWNEVEDGSLILGWSALLAARTEGKAYFELDTHWTPMGASAMALHIVERLDPALIVGATAAPTTEYEDDSDLTRLMGIRTYETAFRYEVTRPGVELGQSTTLEAADAAGTAIEGVRVREHVTSGEPVVAGRTIILHDSFGNALRSLVSPFLSTSVWIGRTNPSEYPAASILNDADTMMIVSVQRRAYGLLVTARLSEQVAASIADRLPAGRSVSLTSTGREELFVDDYREGRTYYLMVEKTSLEGALFEVRGRGENEVDDRIPRKAFRMTGPDIWIELQKGSVLAWIVSVPSRGSR